MERYDTDTALIVVDVQNDFADPLGTLYVRGGQDVVAFANDEIERAHAAGATVVYTQDWHPPDTPHFAKDGGTWPTHCVRDTWGAELAPGLHQRGPVVRKGTAGEDGYSGFAVRDPQTGAQHATGLGDLLRDEHVARVVVLGLATDYCVKETAIDAVAEGFTVEVLRDGIRAVDLDPGDGDRAIEAMAAAGAEIV